MHIYQYITKTPDGVVTSEHLAVMDSLQRVAVVFRNVARRCGSEPSALSCFKIASSPDTMRKRFWPRRFDFRHASFLCRGEIGQYADSTDNECGNHVLYVHTDEIPSIRTRNSIVCRPSDLKDVLPLIGTGKKRRDASNWLDFGFTNW